MSKTIDTDNNEPNVARWSQQKWVLDNLIAANGIDWDQPRSVYLNIPCGMEATADFSDIRNMVRKYADIGPAFASVARRRERKAKLAEADDHVVTARDNYFMAAVQWGAAQWPYHSDCEENLTLNSKKRECYTKYAALADHPIEAAWIPFGDGNLPAWLHLPPHYKGGRIPVVISIPGMDSFKEIFVALGNDRWLSRGVAVLAIDGPGQAEARIGGIKVSTENWCSAGRAIVDWLSSRSEIDCERIGIFGNSFGSFFATLLTAHEPRIKACAVSATCLEPGFHTIFQEASPTYKKRFMYMSGFSDEADFDAFRSTLTWEGHAENISVPYLCVAGEAEELSPLIWAEKMLSQMKCPKLYVIYEGSRHAVGGVPAANNGPYPPVLIADWLVARLNDRPFESERWFVRSNGNVEQAAW